LPRSVKVRPRNLCHDSTTIVTGWFSQRAHSLRVPATARDLWAEFERSERHERQRALAGRAAGHWPRRPTPRDDHLGGPPDTGSLALARARRSNNLDRLLCSPLYPQVAL